VRQFRSHGFVDQVRRLLDMYEVQPHLLLLEITETLLMREDEQIWSDLAALREMGVRVAIDDFGTGYSSLSYLRQRPIDVLKIDKSFIDDMVDSPQQQALVSSIIGLAHTLNLEVVAEGIETEAARDTLMRMGCKLGQGFLFSKPITAAEAFTWLSRHQFAA
jgi:EAL domain-containing protein (putative c-di-GMP-specific phosphodiesterase class I)